MRNEQKRTSTPSTPSNAFSPSFLNRPRHLPDPQDRQHADLAPLVIDPRCAGPWTVEERDAGHGRVWVVLRKEVPPSGAAPVAAYRCHATAGLTAALLPALSVPNHLRLGEPKPTGVPLHDGEHFLGHLSPRGPAADPALPHYLHAARHLATHPESLVHLLRTYDPEALAILGRALARAA